MPQPTSYSPTTDFSADELANTGGRSTVRTAQLDAEFTGIQATLAGVLANLSLNQRDDGEVRDERVKLPALASDVKALLAAGQGLPRGAWLTGAVYALRDVVTQSTNTYICSSAHTAGTFATDLAAVKWMLLALGAATAASAVPFTPTATLAATNVQAAIEEADTEGRALSAAASVSAAAAAASAVSGVASLTLSLATAGASTGAGQVGYLPAGTGAVATTVQTKLREKVSVEDFLPLAFVTTADATTYIQAALSSGATAVDFLSIPLKCDAVTIPAGVAALNVSLTKYTNAAGNMLLVNTGCTVTGKLAGTGLTSADQRCIYAASTGVNDVYLLVEVSNSTRGVQTQLNCKRWKGYVYAHDIVGTVGVSEGYGLLLESAEGCEFVVRAVNIRRHAVYISAGASYNTIDCDIDGCGNYAAQIAALSPQAACTHNSVLVRARNLTTDVATQSGAIAITGKSHYNNVVVFCTGNSTTYEAVRIEGGSSGVQVDHPKGNSIIDGAITGQFTGADVICMLNADGTVVARNRIDAYATNDVIGMRRTGTNLSLHGGYIQDNVINAQGQAIKGIYDEITTVPSWVGSNTIRNNSTALRVDDQTSGKRQGFSRRVTFSGTTASINATNSGDTTVTLSDNIQTAGRAAFAELSAASVQFTDKPFWTSITGAPSETQATLRIYNGHSVGQTFTYYGAVEGD